MLLTPNTLLQDRYLIVRQIGQGGMGAVYEASDQRLGNRVALKQTIVNDPQLLRAFKREARILARLNHPALPNVSDFFSDSKSQFLVMQYIPGDDLETLLDKKRGPFPVMQVLRWADQLLDALEYLHSQKPPIIHRDIKPANIKLLPRGQVILLDFGLAKGGTTGSGHTMSGLKSVFGYTPHYASLEQIDGTGTDERSDLYALGATLYHLLTGIELPSSMARAAAEINKTPDPLRPANELNRQIPVPLANVLAQATALKPTQRLQTAKAMRHALHQATLPPATEPILPRPRPNVRKPRPAPQKRPIRDQSSPTKRLPQDASSENIRGPIRVAIMGTIILTISGLIYGLWAGDPITITIGAAIVGAFCCAIGAIIWIIASAIYRQIKNAIDKSQ